MNMRMTNPRSASTMHFMQKSLVVLSIVTVLAGITGTPTQMQLASDTQHYSVPMAPNTAKTAKIPVLSAPVANAEEEVTVQTHNAPARLVIPSIHLNAPVINVGVNNRGEMDVPDGKTPYVGWYQYGTIPGEVGSAVIDAHVYAAFKNLSKSREGDEIVVQDETGTETKFVIEHTEVYALNEVPLQEIFNTKDTARLNLITCSGTFVKSLNTYDHRLVVFAKKMP